MKRWVRRIVPFLFLGVILNVAVAWMCAWFVPIQHWDLHVRGRTGLDADDWDVHDSSTIGQRFVWAEAMLWKKEAWKKGIGQRSNSGESLSRDELDELPRVFRPNGPPQPDGVHQRLYMAAGFPCLAMTCFADAGHDGSLKSHHSLASRYEYSQDPTGLVRYDVNLKALPLLPLWGGTIVNTLLYAVVALAALAFIRRVRRVARVSLTRAVKTCLVWSLLLGGITTVLVAWCCAYYVRLEYSMGSIGETWLDDPANGDVRYHVAWRDVGPGAQSFYSGVMRSSFMSGPPIRHPAEKFLPSWTDYLNPEPGVAMSRRADARGWPMLAMWTAINHDPRREDYIGERDPSEVRHGIMFPRYNLAGELQFHWSRFLPLAPIWPGFLVDTLFYGAAWSVFLFVSLGPRPIRRAIRRSRGRCLQCAYDLRGDLASGCPECGWNRETKS